MSNKYKSKGLMLRALQAVEEAEVCLRVGLITLVYVQLGACFQRVIAELNRKTRLRIPSTVLSKDGQALEVPQTLQRFAEYFDELSDVSQPSTEIEIS